MNLLEESFWTGLSGVLWCIASTSLVEFCIVPAELGDSGCPRKVEKVTFQQWCKKKEEKDEEKKEEI